MNVVRGSRYGRCTGFLTCRGVDSDSYEEGVDEGPRGHPKKPVSMSLFLSLGKGTLCILPCCPGARWQPPPPGFCWRVCVFHIRLPGPPAVPLLTLVWGRVPLLKSTTVRSWSPYSNLQDWRTQSKYVCASLQMYFGIHHEASGLGRCLGQAA